MATSGQFIKEEDKELLLARVDQLVFVDGIAGFECRRCDRTLIRNYVANCGHKYCANCKKYLIQSKSNCPLPACKRLIENNLDIQDLDFERKLYDFRAHCTNKKYGCPFVSQLKDLGGHLRVCKYTRDKEIPLLIQGNSVVEMILRELSNKFEMLNADVNQIHQSLKDIKSEMDNNKLEIDKKILEMTKILDEKASQTKVDECNNKIRILEVAVEINNQINKAQEIDLEQFNLKSFNQMKTPEMDCFSLAENEGLHFQPNLIWKMSGIKDRLSKGTLEGKSEAFAWPGYAVQAQAKVEVAPSGYVIVSLRLEKNKLGKAIDLKRIPQVYYALRDLASEVSPKHICCTKSYVFATKLKYSLDFKSFLTFKSHLTEPPYNVDDSIVLEVFVEPPWTGAYSQDGTLHWAIDKYEKRKRMAVEKLVWYQESPYFYTGPEGYRLRAKMRFDECEAGAEAKGQGGVSVQICFMPGEFDADLPSAFPHQTTLTLFNRKEPESNITKTVNENIAKKKEYWMHMCEDDEIINVLDNDTLYFRISVKPSK